MNKNKNNNLEERTQDFAREIRMFLKPLAQRPIFYEDVKQLLRSSGSVAANYIEANEAMTRKDFEYRVVVCRKEAKESMFWLSMFTNLPPKEEMTKTKLQTESIELMKIFNAILWKSKRTGR